MGKPVHKHLQTVDCMRQSWFVRCGHYLHQKTPTFVSAPTPHYVFSAPCPRHTKSPDVTSVSHLLKNGFERKQLVADTMIVECMHINAFVITPHFFQATLE